MYWLISTNEHIFIIEPITNFHIFFRESDDRYITRIRSPSPERPRWTNRDQLAYQNRSLDRGMGRYIQEAISNENYPPNNQQMPHLNGFSSLSQATRSLREAAGLPLAGGRRLPNPPPESQRAVMMPQPHTPLPYNQKPERLSTRNRRLPQIPTSSTSGHMANGGSHTLTSSIFGFAKKLTNVATSSIAHSASATTATLSNGIRGGFPNQTGRHRLPAIPTMRTSQSFINGGNQQQRRPGRGAKLPAIPGAGRRQLPGGFHSRSLGKAT